MAWALAMKSSLPGVPGMEPKCRDVFNGLMWDYVGVVSQGCLAVMLAINTAYLYEARHFSVSTLPIL